MSADIALTEGSWLQGGKRHADFDVYRPPGKRRTRSMSRDLAAEDLLPAIPTWGARRRARIGADLQVTGTVSSKPSSCISPKSWHADGPWACCA